MCTKVKTNCFAHSVGINIKLGKAATTDRRLIDLPLITLGIKPKIALVVCLVTLLAVLKTFGSNCTSRSVSSQLMDWFLLLVDCSSLLEGV